MAIISWIIKYSGVLLIATTLGYASGDPPVYYREAWLDLLYYESDGQGYKSLVDNTQFFITDRGKYDPKYEYDASLQLAKSHDVEFRRRFPLRYKRLCEAHGLAYKPLVTGRSDIESVQIVYPSRYMGNPASMFGHLFLIFESKNGLLDSSIFHYTAVPDSVNPIQYIIYGITGGFSGHFSTEPYYKRIKDYNYVEDREVIYYDLILSKQQIADLQLHAEELKYAQFDYYFIDENCAFFIGKALNVVLETNISMRTVFVSPSQIINALQANQALSAYYVRPSLTSQFNQTYQQLSSGQKKDTIRLFLEEKPSVETIHPESLKAFLYYSEYAINNYSALATPVRHNRILAYQKLQALQDSAIRHPINKRPDVPKIYSQKISVQNGPTTGLFASYHPVYYANDWQLVGTKQLDVAAMRLGYDHTQQAQVDIRLVDIVNSTPYNKIQSDSAWRLRSMIGYNRYGFLDQSFDYGVGVIPIKHSMVYGFIGGQLSNYNTMEEQVLPDVSVYPSAGIRWLTPVIGDVFKFDLGYEYRYHQVYLNPSIIGYMRAYSVQLGYTYSPSTINAVVVSVSKVL
ncbi:MAG: DUF4105 domain-containing protein [Flavobacteriaceae bacterium]|nr:DUF4105 domain-containing protein [Flavobacteriaceae bacterium]